VRGLEAGPSLFSVRVPITADLALELNTIGTQVVGELVRWPGRWASPTAASAASRRLHPRQGARPHRS
jgi:hypothetical protein